MICLSLLLLALPQARTNIDSLCCFLTLRPPPLCQYQLLPTLHSTTTTTDTSTSTNDDYYYSTLLYHYHDYDHLVLPFNTTISIPSMYA